MVLFISVLCLGACAAQPCRNGGRCYNSADSVTGFVCQCPGMSDRCEGITNRCAPNPCRNGAR